MNTDLVPFFRNFTHLQCNFPNISQPLAIGGFSLDSKRKYHNDLRNLKYFSVPDEKPHWDLNTGYEIYQRKQLIESERINHILEFIVANAERVKSKNQSGKVLFPDIVCFRGLLRMIMCTPYEASSRSESWIILATKYRGTIYLCQEESDEKRDEILNETEDQKRFQYYGYKFEQYILTEKLNIPNDLTKPVIESEEFGVMFKSTFEKHKILYAAEMDGVISDAPIDVNADLSKNPLSFVEVKTKKQEENQRQHQNYVRFKLRKWWCQSFLVGIKDVYVGVRSAGGIVHRVEKVSVKSMPKIAERQWSSLICMKFCCIFLDTVKAMMEKIDDPHTVFRFSFNPRISDHIQYEIISEKSEVSFLPTWYVDFLDEISPLNRNK
ncbi:Decapping nuclease DXO homolog [Sergentomyia squamirostris]